MPLASILVDILLAHELANIELTNKVELVLEHWHSNFFLAIIQTHAIFLVIAN
jgi:hypothetical protein